MKVRKYSERDKGECRRICCEGSYGITEDTDLKALFIADCEYYLDNAGGSSFVAVNDYDEAIGYILCETDYKAYIDGLKSKYWKKIIVSPDILMRKITEALVYGKYRKDYPAHLRIAVMPLGQRMGVGTALVGALKEYLKSEGIKGVMAVCNSHNVKGTSFYKKYGFTEGKKFLGYTAFLLDIDNI